MSAKMKAEQIIQLLATRHSDDVFVPECKTGGSYGNGCLRLDAWAMKNSWSPALSFGYEVKVSRSDFLQDEKWTGYLDYCTDFYFVCPSGIIQPDEVGEGAGLIWVAKTGTRLYTKKKAPRRDVEVPEDLYRYILMWRTNVVREHARDRVEELRHWAEGKAANRQLGHLVNRSICEVVARVKSENLVLRARAKAAEEFGAEMKRLGLDGSWDPASELRRIAGGGAGRKLRRVAEDVVRDARQLLEELDRASETGEGASA